MKYPHFSIRTTLLLIIGLLTTFIALLVGANVYDTWTEVREAQTLKEGSIITNQFYEASKYLSLERGTSLAIVSTPPETTEILLQELMENRKAGDSALQRALTMVRRKGGADLSDKIRVVSDQYKLLEDLRHRLDVYLASTDKKRKEIPRQEIFDTLTSMIVQIQALNAGYYAGILAIDPIVTQQLTFKHFVWEITEYAGRQYAAIGILIVENAPLTPQMQIQLLSWEGRIQHGWEIVHDIAASSGLSDSLEPYIKEAETHYFLTFDQIKEIFYTSAEAKNFKSYPVSIEIWLGLASEAVDSLMALKDAALQETQRYADRLEMNAKKTIFADVFIFMCVLALSLYSWFIIILRVIQPVDSIVNTLYKATRGEPYQFPDVEKRDDEIGKLVRVLEVFQENSRRIEKTSKELAERRRYLKTVLETIIDGIITFDQAGNIHLVNRAVEVMFGYPESELLSRNISLLIPVDAGSFPHYDFAEGPERTPGIELAGRRRDGGTFPVELSVTEMDNEGSILYVALLRDITARKASEEEREHHLKNLEKSNRELDDFAYIASHDLKEPLRGLHNFSHFLLEDYGDKLDEEGRNMLQTLTRLTQQLESYLNTLLHYSRLGRTELSIRETDLNDVVRDVISMHAIQIKDVGARIDIVNKLPAVICDHIRIAEVYQNLITNCLKYSDKKDKRIEIGFMTDHPRFPGERVFFVRDNGIGIEAKHLEVIFKIFKRLHPKGAYGGGTGSGLTIAKKIINQHGGEIWAESEGKDKGTSFLFTIPEPEETPSAPAKKFPEILSGA